MPKIGKLRIEAVARGMTDDELIIALLQEANSISGAARLLNMSTTGFKRHMRQRKITFSRNTITEIKQTTKKEGSKAF